MEKWTKLLVIVATWLLIIVFVGVLIRLALYIQVTVLLFALATLLAYALDPVVEVIREKVTVKIGGKVRSLSRSTSVTAVFLLLIGIFVVAALSLARPAMHQINLLKDRNLQAQYRQQAMHLIVRGDDQLRRLGVKQPMQSFFKNPSSLPPSIQAAESDVERTTFLLIGKFAETLGEAVFVLLITVYLLIYSAEMKIKFNSIMPEGLLPYAINWEEDVNRILGGFVRGQLTISILLGIISAIACAAVGIRLWLLIGLFVVGASLIPVFGPYIGAAPAIILALLTPTHFANRVIAALVLLAVFVTINEAASKILYPRLVGRAIGLHEVLVLFVIFGGLEVGGVAGVLFAAPVTAIAIATTVHLFRFWQNLPDSLLFTGVVAPKLTTSEPD